MQSFFESIMLICFGLSWPISVYKSIKSRSAKGKSAVFIIAIIIGYNAGITGKIIGGQSGYILLIYAFNLCMVSIDLALYFVNRKREEGVAYERVCEEEKRNVQGV